MRNIVLMVGVMKLEVLTRDDMRELSKKLSRAGIMNRPVEETKARVDHQVVIRGRYSKLVEVSSKVSLLGDELEAIQLAYKELMDEWEIGEKKTFDDLFEDPDIPKLSILSALIEAGAIEEENGEFVLKSKPLLDGLEIELSFPLERVENKLDDFEGLMVMVVTEYTLEKHYYVEVIEVERELLESALEIAREYATEESIVEATFDGVARSVLAEKILELAKKYRRKNELIEALMEIEPITVEAGSDKMDIYYDEEAIEDFLKTLQTLGYLKVKGNRIWV